MGARMRLINGRFYTSALLRPRLASVRSRGGSALAGRYFFRGTGAGWDGLLKTKLS
jgi:hypothetical protein